MSIPHMTITLQTRSGKQLQRSIPSYNPPPEAVIEGGVIYVRTAEDQRGEVFIYREAFTLILAEIDPLR